MRKDDEPSFVRPPDDIPCRDCLYRQKPIDGFTKYKSGNCKKYPLPGYKPMRVLRHGEDCAYYEEDPNEQGD